MADQMETGLYKGNRLEAVRAARDIWLGLEHLHTVLGTPHLALHPNNIVLARSSAKRASDDVASAFLHAMAELLLGKGAKVDHCTPQGRTPLYAACQQGQVGTARLCLDHGAAVDQKDKMGLTPLYNACFEGHASAAKLLLDRGADGHAVLNMEKNMRADFSDDIDVLLEDWANGGGGGVAPLPIRLVAS